MNKVDNPKNTGPKSRVVAAIDIGSNAIRMAVGQILDNGRLEVLDRMQRPIHLGQDTFQRGRLHAQTIRSAVAVLRQFHEALLPYQVRNFRAVATSAVREAANGETFVDRIFMATGLEVSVISGAEESRLMISAVRRIADRILARRKNVLVAQVGGGCTVLNLLNKGSIQTSQSLPIGSIRQQEVLSVSDESAEQAARMIQNQVAGALSAFGSLLPLKTIQTVMAVGPDARWMAAQIGKPCGEDQVLCIARERFDDLVETCRAMGPDQLARRYGLSFFDAETLGPALLVYQVLLNATRAKTILVPNAYMLDGILAELGQELTGEFDEAVYRQTLQSAQGIAAKYHVNCEHAERVTDLALRLFDLFQPVHRLNPRHRLLLNVAALLHEVGTFVSSRAHHKHTLYLVANTEIFGLTQEELLVVANVARYHRQSRPKLSHPEYRELAKERRMVVNKLCALLRVADCLDVTRSQQIRDAALRLQDETLVIEVSSTGDLALEQRSLKLKSDVFQDIYGMDVRIDNREATL